VSRRHDADGSPFNQFGQSALVGMICMSASAEVCQYSRAAAPPVAWYISSWIG
jgi:hypothetical protein